MCKLLLTFWLAAAPAAPCGFANDKKKDPDEIGNRDLGKGVNFYSNREGDRPGQATRSGG